MKLILIKKKSKTLLQVQTINQKPKKYLTILKNDQIYTSDTKTLHPFVGLEPNKYEHYDGFTCVNFDVINHNGHASFTSPRSPDHLKEHESDTA